jgi:hypothetical protein
MKKKNLLIIISVTILIQLTGCGKAATQIDETNTIPVTISQEASVTPVSTVTPVPEPITIPLTDIQKESASYIPISEVGTYRTDIITDALLAGTTLPEATAKDVPYWTGYIMENKIFANFQNDFWSQYREEESGDHCFIEQEFAYLKNNGFNCARIVYSMSFLSDPDDVNSINVAELDQLDELISWGLKYNIHIMLSITGMPGKRNTSCEEENVQNSSQIFTDTSMEKAFAAYWDMLAKRYADIPAKVLSFELLAEPEVPDASLDRYYKVLAPVAKNIWTYNPERIVIANDLSKQLPEKMAEIGCCLSLHTHIYAVDENRLRDFGIENDATWPLQYFPEYYNGEDSGELTLKSEDGFLKGKLTIYYEGSGTTAAVSEDGKTIARAKAYEAEDTLCKKTIDIASGTKKIVLKPSDDGSWLAITISQEGKDDITIPTHSLYGEDVGIEPLPSIKIHNDGTLENIDNPQKFLNADYFESVYLKKFIDCAKKNGVSFLMTEVGTDTVDLTPEEYVAYHSEWLDALSRNKIPWMYNCIHNILAPEQGMWLNANNSSFTEFNTVGELLPQYQENVIVTQMLKKYQK